MRTKISLGVFCGASKAVSKDFIDEAYHVGQLIAKEGFHVVYGAGDSGLMGAVAKGALDAKGTVTGVYPKKVLSGLEPAYEGLTETIMVDDMHTRKMTMFVKSHAFLILPGGFGTMDETFEVITWKQLHTHTKPIVLYNYKHYWKNWEALTAQFISMGFAGEKTRTMYEIVDTVGEAFRLVKEGCS